MSNSNSTIDIYPSSPVDTTDTKNETNDVDEPTENDKSNVDSVNDAVKGGATSDTTGDTTGIVNDDTNDGAQEGGDNHKSATPDIFTGAYMSSVVDLVVPMNIAPDRSTEKYVHPVYRHHVADDGTWTKELDDHTSTNVSVISIVHSRLTTHPYAWCSSRSDLINVLDALENNPHDVLLLTRDGKKKGYIPSIRDRTRRSLQYLCDNSETGKEIDTILSYSKYKYWADIPMNTCVYIPVSSHTRTIPSIYGAVAKSLYLWNDKNRDSPSEDTLRKTSVTLRRNVMTFVFHNLYTCYMDGVCFDSLLQREYETHKVNVESFYSAMVGGAKFFNPCVETFSDDWIRGHWNEWDNSLKYLMYIAQSHAISDPSEPTKSPVPAHPGNTTDIFFISQYVNRMIVLCNIQNSLANAYHPFQVALPVSTTAHMTVPILLYTESNGHYGLLWFKHFGVPKGGTEQQPPASMVFTITDQPHTRREGLYSKRRKDWIVYRDPFSVEDYIEPMDRELEYQPPVALFIPSASVSSSASSATPASTTDSDIEIRGGGITQSLVTNGTAQQEECVRLGAYAYPLSIQNIERLKEYISTEIEDPVDTHRVDNMPVDVRKLISGGTISFIDMSTKRGQSDYRHAVEQKWIIHAP